MELHEERALVARARHDPEAFGQLFEAHYQRILTYSIARTGNVAIAEDITSTTFMKAFQKLWQFRWRNVSFAAWLYRIATNEIASHFRSNYRHPRSSLDALHAEGVEFPDTSNLPEELMHAEEELARHKDFLHIQKQIAILPIHYQEVLVLRFLEQKSLAEIAAILKKKEGTVKSLLSRGLAMLREQEERNRSANTAL